MDTRASGEIAGLVERARVGDERAASELMPLVYAELRRIAGAYMRRERPGQTLQPTALVHEAYLRLLRDRSQDWEGRSHFLAIAARSMRQILVERARAKNAAKRGGSRQRITFDEADVAGEGAAARGESVEADLLAIDEALGRLALQDDALARVVELRFFGGLTIPETADVLGISPATVKRHWTLARAWLRREVAPQSAEEPDDRRSEPEAERGGGR